ncbi:MAG: acetolactate synthase [Betaproteobacteria bacterium]|nr:acetolactate synthase [Betaproteobacteria bacterium]
MASHTTAHYFLEGLNEIGIDYLFCNLGTDHAPLIEEMARWRREGLTHPKIILCPHENVAMHMAAGYAAMTGRGQGVLVHVDAGTANAAMGMHNLFRSRIPVLLMAGRAPFTIHGELPGSRDNFVHFVQEPYDQASVVRPYVKWEYNLHSGVIAKEALRRAHTMMMSDPKGPAYMMLPREVLAAPWEEEQIKSYPAGQYGAATARGVDAEFIDTLADKLMAAQYPVLVSAYAGRNAEAPALLDELARLTATRVIEFNPLFLNIPHDSPCFAGFQSSPHVEQADFGLLLDVDVPWIPKYTQQRPGSFWAQVDIDVNKRDIPMWGFGANLRAEADSTRVLAQLIEHIKHRVAAGDAAFTARVKTRMAALMDEAATRQLQVAHAATDKGVKGTINPQYLCAEVGRALGPDDIIVNEGIRNMFSVFNNVPRTKPTTSIGLGSGGLGYSGGTALGAKLARPNNTVVQFVGDGGFYFSTPTSVLAVSRQYKLPIFTVIMDNTGWGAVKESTLRMYPDGVAKEEDQFAAVLAPDMEFSKIAEAAGAYGESLTDPEQVAEAVARCLAEVKGGRSAVLHARVTKL